MRGGGGAEVCVAGQVDVGAVVAVRDIVKAVEVGERERVRELRGIDVGRVELRVGVGELSTNIGREEGVAGGEFDDRSIVEDVLRDAGCLSESKLWCCSGQGDQSSQRGDGLYRRHTRKSSRIETSESMFYKIPTTMLQEVGGTEYLYVTPRASCVDGHPYFRARWADLRS